MWCFSWLGLLIILFHSFFTGCGFLEEPKYSELQIGAEFGESRDGFYKKFPHNYCLIVNYASPARLFKLTGEDIDAVASGITYDGWNLILQGHFIKGYFDEKHIIFWEEQKNGNAGYWIFDFANENSQFYTDIESVYAVIGYKIETWFSLCNTYDEIIVIK